jgi:RNA polymerase sigma-54 factor
MTAMETRIDLGQEMRPWVSPSLIEANHILSLSRQELQEAIQIELFNNPALEMDEERDACPLCGGLLEGTFCPTCLISQRTDDGTAENFEDFPEQLATATVGREDGDEFDPGRARLSLLRSERVGSPGRATDRGD